MEPRPDRTRELFAAALELPVAERQRWLENACIGDAARLARVRELLEAHERAGSFLADPGAHVRRAAAVAADEQPGDSIGAYKLLENIGEGGFGTVWMAEQRQPVRRLVALKLLKPGMDSKQVVARFEQERQALALMTHPNVAQVFDAGTTERGRPFFVMELVKGVPITDYCEREKLPVRARLDLFVQVCRAVQHAHGKGLIHRDLKPRNVLVATADARPLAKVIDFGIAKATGARLTEKTLFTEHHAMVGTLEYMSPEQAEGLLDVDTRSDVYSLGALLYELLTGSTPFDSKQLVANGYAEILRTLREVEPQRPSVRVSSRGSAGWAGGAGRAGAPDGKDLFGVLKGDLDWVVLKALEKDRGRRYASADGLAEDVQRYLAGEAVQAVPPSVGYRVRKFVRRHRTLTWAALAVVSAIGVGSALAGYFWTEQRSARQRQQTAERGEAASRASARFATYQNGVRAAIESATAGNREQALRVLAGCEPALRQWEWRYARAVAEDSVRFVAEGCVGWGADASGGTLVLLDRAKAEGGLLADRLRLVDTATGRADVLWHGVASRSNRWRDDLNPRSSQFVGHRPVLLRDGCTIAVVPEDVAFDHAQDRSARRRLMAFDIGSKAWRFQTPVAEGWLVAVALADERVVACDPTGVVTCSRLDTGDEVWRARIDAGEPADIFVSCDEDAVVVLHGVDPARCTSLRLTNGERLWEAALPPLPSRISEEGVSESDHEDAPWCPTRLLATPVPTRVAVLDHLLSTNDPDAPLSSPMVILDLATGGIRSGSRMPVEMLKVHVETWAMAMRAIGSQEAGAVRPFTEQLDALRRGMPTAWFFSARGSELCAVTSRTSGEVLHVGNFGFDANGSIDSPYYTGGINDICPQTWEWRTQPRQLAGQPRSPIGGSGLCGVAVEHRLIVCADRARDVFPPRPLGIECRVEALGMWRGLPAAIYPGGVTTLDCDGAARLPVEDGPFPIDVAAANETGTHLAVASGQGLRVLVTADGHDLGDPIQLAWKPIAVALDPDAEYAIVVTEAAGGACQVACYASADGRPAGAAVMPIGPGRSSRIALSAGEDCVACATGPAPLRLFSMPMLAEVALPSAVAQPASALGFDPSGKFLAVGRPDGRLEILERDGTLLVQMVAHTDEVSALAWSHDGVRLFSAGRDGFVRLWDPSTGSELLNLGDNNNPGTPTIRAFDGMPCSLFATPDGERLICGYDDGAIRVWDSVPWSERVDRRNAALPK